MRLQMAIQRIFLSHPYAAALIPFPKSNVKFMNLSWHGVIENRKTQLKIKKTEYFIFENKLKQ